MTASDKVTIYTDGACKGNPGRGGWAAVVERDGVQYIHSGHHPSTTNNRMELMAAIKGLEEAAGAKEVVLYSDSTYLVNTMTKGWKRNVNQDLWQLLDRLAERQSITWKWVRGHDGNPGNEMADTIASQEAALRPSQRNPTMTNSPETSATEDQRRTLSHLDEQGRARMVDVGGKPTTNREAVARGHVSMQPKTLRLIKDGLMKKGDVLTTAQLAGIMAAKRTAELIPLCHPLPLDQVEVDLELDEERSRVNITATAKTSAKTGVEMEALTAVSVAALTLYDMCKAVDRGMRIEAIRLVRKQGGQSGDLVLEE